ncbi:Carbohydrate-selective porin, OprB family [Pigmentiphaga humi]|uniref:Carbohydrate-selective porin, OprB family n=1 Tax=Pigmentiphaga humi TaxID=2478468 RepID=A0A3P4B076_9BURK|nr:carbohydrate porin [Pigmentiphaga humi]VCU68515.1 Carbohydrate-selective porin, OprB family [Pigmentiphaga humi]
MKRIRVVDALLRKGMPSLLAACLAWLPAHAQTPEDPVESFAVHGQSTYVWQRKASMRSPYEGPNSLGGGSASSYSFTATVDVGARLWEGAEVHLGGEGARGATFSDLHGLGGLTNGELAKTAGSDMTYYRAKAFLRQTWGLGGGREAVESDMDQLGGFTDKRRIVLTAGNFSVLDVFDGVSVSHDPRTQFMNWAFLTHGSYDYAADARGYTWGVALEYIDDGWAVRAGRFMQPKESNGLPLDTRIGRHYGDQVELEKSYTAWGRPGTLRVLAFRNKARMGSFDDAVALAAAQGGAPDLAAVRREHAKVGLGVSVEQKLGDAVTVFARASAADGKTETYAFTEIDRGVSGGIVVDGAAWGRAGDTAGLAVAVNALSAAHRQYLARGGLGAFLGDGRLDYGTERIAETYYSWQAARFLWVTADAQYIRNPGYNRDRGPAKVFSMRVHAAF